MAKDNDPKEVELFSESTAGEARNLFLQPSRIIEYFPPGPTVVAKNCTYGGVSYSKGSLVNQGGFVRKCSGDAYGTWVDED
jgi:hypothetical protein